MNGCSTRMFLEFPLTEIHGGQHCWLTKLRRRCIALDFAGKSGVQVDSDEQLQNRCRQFLFVKIFYCAKDL